MIKVLMTLPVKIGFDGMSKQVLSYGKYMDKSDVIIDLVSCRGFDPKMKSYVDEANFHNIYRLEYRDTNQIKYFLDLYKIMKKEKYDVIHVNGQSATMSVEMLAAKLAGCKLRVAHSHSSRCLHKKAHNMLKPLFNATYNDAIACSKEAGDWLFGDKPYWILNNGIDIDKYKFSTTTRTEFRKKLKLSDKDIAVCHVGAFEPWKNHKFLIDVFDEIKKENSGYKLFLFGINGTTQESILSLINERRLEDTIRFMGTADDINNYLQAMDLMLLPSLYEGFPVTVVEWQANGLPCIVSDTISKDVKITDLVKQLSIEDGTTIWKNEILKHNNEVDVETRKSYYIKVSKAGYNIKNNVSSLKEHYIERLGDN